MRPSRTGSARKDLLYPAFRPVGTQGLAMESIDRDALSAHAAAEPRPAADRRRARPSCRSSTPSTPGAFDIVVNGDHLLSWGVEPSEIQDAAIAEPRRLVGDARRGPTRSRATGGSISSDTGDGWDAARILLPEVLAHLTAELGSVGRILVGLPERHLLIAGSLRPDDADFATLFAEFVVEHSGGADEPIDRRVFELVDGRLVEFAGV